MVKGNRPASVIRPRDPVTLDRPTDPRARCAGERSVVFTPTSDAVPGDTVHLVPGPEWWWLVAGNKRIGRMAIEAVPVEMSACVAFGWAFMGTVTSVGEATGVALLTGYPTR